MATNTTVIQTPISPAGQYRIPFDYLAKKFVVVTLLNSTSVDSRVLVHGVDFTIPSPTYVQTDERLDTTGFDTVQVSRYTDTELLVDFRDGSVLTAQGLTTSELQAIHIAEEGRDVVAREVQPIVDGVNSLMNKALRVTDKEIAALGDAAFRAGKVIAFDSAGDPALVLPADGTATDVMLELAKPTGATNINTESGRNVQEELDVLHQAAGGKPTDIFIGSFFNSNADVSMTLVKSFDGKNFSVMNKKPLLLPNGNPAGNRDPSILYHKGYWYVSYTNGNANQDFSVMRSPDLISWTIFNCKAGDGIWGKPGSILGGTIPAITPIWAPSLFVDTDGELYAQLTVGIEPRAPDRDGTEVNWGVPFATRCTDLETMTFGPAVQMLEDKSVQRIDVEVTEIPGGYILLIKNEFSKEIELWRSSTYIGGYSKVASLNYGGRYVEGPSMVYINHLQTYRIYADAFREQGVTWYIDTKDFVTYSAPQRVQCPNPLRHGTVYNIANSYEPEAALGTFITAAAVTSTDYLAPKWAEGGLANGATTLVPQENYVYRVSGNNASTITINEKGGDYFYLLVGSGSDAAGIVIQGSKVDGGPFTIGFGQTNLNLVEVKYNEQSQLYQVGVGVNDRSSAIALNTLGGWPNLSNAWVPKHNAIYTTNGAMAETIIGGLSTIVPDGTRFYLWIGSGANGGKVTFKSGGPGLSVFGRDLTLSGAMGHGDALHVVTKLAGSWKVTVSGPTDFEDVPLVRRRAYFVGDSITVGSPGSSYAPFLCDALSMTLAQNAAVGGAKMADAPGQIANLPASLGEDSVVFVALGTNDFRGNTALGVPTDGMNGSAATFYRHCQLAAQALLPKLGNNTRVYFISPLASNFNSANSGGNTLKMFADAIEQTCNAFGFGFINGAFTSQMNIQNGRTGVLTTDGLHPNGSGAAYIGRNYGRFLRNSGF